MAQPGRWSVVWKDSTLRRVLSDPLGALGLVLVLLLVVGAVGADWLTPWSPTALNIRQRLQAPDLVHLLGTDHLGRDILARVLHGGRIALYVSIVSVGVALGLGCLLGMAAGYGPRWLDNALILLFDAVRSFPTVLFALAVVALVGPSLETIMLIVVVTTTPVYGRIVRTLTLSLKSQEFVLAERAMGAGPIRVLAHHVLPNLIGPLLILASMEIPVVIAIESGLSFLGLGVRPPTPSWGSILNDGYGFIRDTPWPVIAAGVPIMLTTLGFTFLGESLRDIFDPRLQREP
jgi:peptide/nickel transport system permease protein